MLSRTSLQARSIKPKQVLVMDFDGVILQNKGVLRHVQDRVVDYVRQNVYDGYMSEAEARTLNTDLYTRYGHTHVGMKKLFLPHSRISHFNDFVYDREFLASLYDNYKQEDSIYMTMEYMDTIVGFLKESGIHTFILSNSPCIWCNTWMKNMVPRVPSENIIGSDHVILETSKGVLLKPSRIVYNRVEMYIKMKFNNPKDLELVFVDDSQINLDPLVKDPSWRPIFFSGATPPHGTPPTGTPSLEHITSLSELPPLFEKLMNKDDIDRLVSGIKA
jgi:hypothetical protein